MVSVLPLLRKVDPVSRLGNQQQGRDRKNKMLFYESQRKDKGILRKARNTRSLIETSNARCKSIHLPIIINIISVWVASTSSILIENLVRVRQNSVQDPCLQTCVCNLWTSMRAHQGWCETDRQVRS